MRKTLFRCMAYIKCIEIVSEKVAYRDNVACIDRHLNLPIDGLRPKCHKTSQTSEV